MANRLPIDLSIPWEVVPKLFLLPDAVRSMGVHIVAGRGSGKSRLLGFLIFQDFLRGTPTILIDAVGGSIDNFLFKACQLLPLLPEEIQEQCWSRILYVDMSGKQGTVVPFPLYFRLGGGSLYKIAQRPIDTFKKLDPHLTIAPIHGFNQLFRIATFCGMILAACGYQITEAASLLTNPEQWRHRFAEAVANYPELAEAVAFFHTHYKPWDEQKTSSFRTKLALLTLDPAMRAMVGAATPGIDWHRIVENGTIVLLDFRHVHDVERRRFLMLFCLEYFLAFVKHRGLGRHKPVSMVIDELAAITNFQTEGENPMAQTLDALINVYARNMAVWPTIAHQEMFQFDELTQHSLLTMGTQIIGSTSDHEAAVQLAKTFIPADPFRIKWRHPIYWGVPDMDHPIIAGRDVIFPDKPVVIDYKNEFMPLDEQHYLDAQRIKNQRTFHFLVRPAVSEGTVGHTVYPITIKDFDAGIYVNEPLVTRARSLLSQRAGVPIDSILAEIEQRPFALPTSRSHVLPAGAIAPHPGDVGHDPYDDYRD